MTGPGIINRYEGTDLSTVPQPQCDQIGRFIGFWATFQSLWQQLICPNLPHSQAIFIKVSKSLIFLKKQNQGNFYRHLAIFFWSHCTAITLLLLGYYQRLLPTQMSRTSKTSKPMIRKIIRTNSADIKGSSRDLSKTSKTIFTQNRSDVFVMNRALARLQ